jgi:hypothetical protein
MEMNWPAFIFQEIWSANCVGIGQIVDAWKSGFYLAKISEKIFLSVMEREWMDMDGDGDVLIGLSIKFCWNFLMDSMEWKVLKNN